MSSLTLYFGEDVWQEEHVLFRLSNMVLNRPKLSCAPFWLLFLMFTPMPSKPGARYFIFASGNANTGSSGFVVFMVSLPKSFHLYLFHIWGIFSLRHFTHASPTFPMFS